MKAEHTVAASGPYTIVVANPDEGNGAPPFPMQLYRNRVRLGSTESLHEIRWRGYLETDDVIEADGERAVTLTVTHEDTDAREAHSRNDAAEPPVAHV